MKNEQKTQGFSLGAQIGGPDAAAATRGSIGKLRQVLLHYCRGPYSDAIDEIALILRVDGKIQHWERSGVGKVFVRKKGKYIEAEIFVPRGIWEGNDEENISKYLACNVMEATKLVIGALERAAVSADYKKICMDIELCIDEYLGR